MPCIYNIKFEMLQVRENEISLLVLRFSGRPLRAVNRKIDKLGK